MTALALFAIWYLFGWWFAAHIWRRKFDLELADVVFISAFSFFGPLIGLAWLFSNWLDARPYREPTVIMKRREAHRDH